MVTKPIWPNGRFGVPQITPYTYRDGQSLLELIKSLRDHVVEQLHPSLQHAIDQLVADVESKYDTAHDRYVDGVQEFQRIHDAFMSDVNAHLIALNDSAVTDLVNDESSLLGRFLRDMFPTIQDVEQARQDIFLNVREFGAVGDGVQNDSPGFQAAIDHATEVGGTVYVPRGHFVLQDTLYLPAVFSLFSPHPNSWSSFHTHQPGGSFIETRAPIVFDAQPGVTRTRAHITGGVFRSTGDTHTLFGGALDLTGAVIDRLVANQYFNVFDCRVSSVSKIMNGVYSNIKGNYINGKLVDSYVQNNYINGAPQAGFNATGIRLDSGSSHSTIQNNFFDFLKTAIRFDFASTRINIMGNVIEYCHRGIGKGGSGRMAPNKVSIQGNTFNRNNKEFWESYFSNPDSDMLSQPSSAILFPEGARSVSILGNQFIENSHAIRIISYPCYNISEHGNIYEYNTTDVTYRAGTGSVHELNLKNIYFESLDHQTFQTVPSGAIGLSVTGTDEVENTKFDKQHIYVNNMLIVNHNGQWYTADGRLVAVGSTPTPTTGS